MVVHLWLQDVSVILHYVYNVISSLQRRHWNEQGGKVHCVLLSSHLTSTTLCQLCCQSVCEHGQMVGDKSEGVAIVHLMWL